MLENAGLKYYEYSRQRRSVKECFLRLLMALQLEKGLQQSSQKSWSG